MYLNSVNDDFFISRECEYIGQAEGEDLGARECEYRTLESVNVNISRAR
jgi:hypothetical protein